MRISKLVLFAFLITPVIISCKKDTVSPNSDPNVDTIGLNTNCMIDQVTRTESGSVEILTYSYLGNKISKITQSREGSTEVESYTEVTLNTDGTYQKIEEFSKSDQGYQLKRLYTYTYNAEGKISVVNETDYDSNETSISTTTLAYSGGNLVSAISTGSDKMKVTDITYENGNMKTATLDLEGDGVLLVQIVVTSDDKYNNAKHGLPIDNLLDLYNKNNMVSVETTAAFTIDNIEIPAGSKIMNRTLTYNANGEVLKMIDHPTIFDENESHDRVKDFTYMCY